jgi:dTDP-4-dehydrorhamnose 3,5-epimerase
MDNFKTLDTKISKLQVIERFCHADNRGFLDRIFCEQSLSQYGWVGHVSQINHTLTLKKGTVRGLHYQNPPHSEIKLVSCIRGKIFDVAVDIREGSETFMQWHAEILTEDNNRSLLIPKGFAHGFQALSDNCVLIYVHSEPYKNSADSGLRYNDPGIAIKWPLTITEISEKDSNFSIINSKFTGVIV